MNKKFSTLLCGALALFSISANAQTWMKIQTNGGELVKKGDSVVLVAKNAPETKTAASLWSVDVVSRETSGNKIYKFTNKATNTTLKLNGNDLFAVGSKDAVRHQLDTLDVTNGAATKTLFTVEGGFSIAIKQTNLPATVTPDTGDYKTNKIDLVLAVPGDMTHWMTVAELNQCASFQVPLFAAMEGVDAATAAYEFISAAESATSADYIFNVKSLTSGKYLAVDSANVTKTSTVNLVNQSDVFGFDVKFGGNATKYKNFGIKFNPINDSIAVAVMDSTLAWNVAGKKVAGNVKNAGNAVAWLGNVQFVNDKAEYITVDSLTNSTNGQAYWAEAPVALEAGEALADGLYILTAKNGILGMPWISSCKPGDIATVKNEYLPENQWMIKGKFENGIYSYTAVNRYFGGNPMTLKRVVTCEGESFVFGTNDTVSVKAIDANYGFKVFEAKELASSEFYLGLVNQLGAEDVYMVMNDDATINVLNTEAPLAFRATIAGEGKNFNDKAFATDTLAYYNLYTLNAKGDTLWVASTVSAVNASMSFAAKKDVAPTPFLFKAENEGEYKMLVASEDCTYDGILAIRVHENGGAATITSVNNVDVSLFTIEEVLDDAEYALLEAGHYVIVDNSKGNVESGELDENEVLTKTADKAAKFLSLGDKLGEEAAIEENFSLWIEEAHVCEEAGERLFPTYYILKGATVDADTVRGDFLTAKGEYKATGDSLMSFVTGKAKINDTMTKVNAAANTFLFKITDVEGQYEICSAKDKKATLALINGTVVLSKTLNALPVIVTKTSVVPTANENIAAEGVTVIAGNGNVTIAGAAGKKVVIANILGQTVANTIIASDNATIAAPAGVVVVKVEGEAAVKAIVK